MIKAQKDYKPYEVVLECPPFVHNINDKYKGQVCDHCLTKSDGLKKCANCGHMYYCNRNCQRNDWRAGHRYECQIFKNHYQNLEDINNLAKPLLRLYLNIKADPQIVNRMYDTVDGKQRCFNDLMTHNEDIMRDSHRCNNIIDLYDRISSSGVELSLNDFINFYGKYVINSYEICFGDNIHPPHRPCGTGMFIGASVLNHSCASNVCFQSVGNKLLIISEQYIKAGDELTVSYLNKCLLMPTDRRRMQLKSYYYFDCHCRRCDNN
ncbi:N-lysine methyltransferase SMYD2-B-like [Oppia nitens]|uniref:N-lysine methyltransferase SMYD2-B-like n=1 Tax=Oppia nitens TaxID=1686743 RepID=UPI0023DA3D73|nr:N-lysine methyltransferase SMYD2-B-like [Oppia nitens]